MPKTIPDRGASFARLGQHLCWLYESDADMEAWTVPFLTAGLMAGEKCAVIASEPRLRKMRRLLREQGADPSMLSFSGQLIMRSEVSECPLSASAVNLPQSDDAVPTINPALTTNGFGAYRCVFAVTDFLCHLDGQALIEREIALNKLLAKLPATLILLYDRRLMSEALTRDIMELHPRLVDRGHMYENPAYVLPEELL